MGSWLTTTLFMAVLRVVWVATPILLVVGSVTILTDAKRTYGTTKGLPRALARVYLVLAAVIASILLFGCSSDAPPCPEQNVEPVVGWVEEVESVYDPLGNEVVYSRTVPVEIAVYDVVQGKIVVKVPFSIQDTYWSVRSE